MWRVLLVQWAVKWREAEWADIVHFVAWLETRLAEDVYELMARAGNRRSKVPFTDAGIASG
jgi:hypothetical protein